MERAWQNNQATLRAATSGYRREIEPFVRAFYGAEDEAARAPFRDQIIRRTYARIERFRAVMTQRAFDFYAITSDADHQHPDPYPIEAVEGRVRSAAAALFASGDVDAYVDSLEYFVEREVNGGRFES